MCFSSPVLSDKGAGVPRRTSNCPDILQYLAPVLLYIILLLLLYIILVLLYIILVLFYIILLVLFYIILVLLYIISIILYYIIIIYYIRIILYYISISGVLLFLYLLKRDVPNMSSLCGVRRARTRSSPLDDVESIMSSGGRRQSFTHFY